jgi:anti-anti-sigma factor
VHPVVVDLSSVSFIDSGGLGALLEFQNHLRREKRQLAIVVPEGTAVAVMFRLEGLQDRLPVFETRRAALEDLKS